MLNPKDIRTQFQNVRSEVRSLKDQIVHAGNKLQASHLNNYLITVDQQDGYEFIETSKHWKQVCSTLPCFTQCWWADYLTAVAYATINHAGKQKNVVVQLWKGRCERLGGKKLDDFPGGIGAEVGIYEIVDSSAASNGVGGSYWFYNPVKEADKALYTARTGASSVAQSNPWLNKLTAGLPRRQSGIGGSPGAVWYPIRPPYPKLWFQLTYKGKQFFQTAVRPEQQTYWLTRWMAPNDYESKYAPKHETPQLAAQYTLDYTIDGIRMPSW